MDSDQFDNSKPSNFLFFNKIFLLGGQPPQPKSAAAARDLLGRIAMGVAAAAYVLMMLIAVMIVAAVLGVGLVSSWAEEPVYVRESVQFDYSDAHPTALLTFGNGPFVPPGHTIYVSLALLMPDSDYNRDIGIFQLNAELISTQGNVIAKSSHPSMLRFRSWPIRYARTFLMGVPLLLGIMTETQRLTFPALKHKEAVYPRTEDIRLTIIPRAGTSFLPQFYNAQVVVVSKPPWLKEMAHRWKVTLCVWTTLYIFMMLVMFLVLFLKPLIFPGAVVGKYKYEEEETSVGREQRGRRRRRLVESREGCRSLSRDGNGVGVKGRQRLLRGVRRLLP